MDAVLELTGACIKPQTDQYGFIVKNEVIKNPIRKQTRKRVLTSKIYDHYKILAHSFTTTSLYENAGWVLCHYIGTGLCHVKSTWRLISHQVTPRYANIPKSTSIS